MTLVLWTLLLMLLLQACSFLHDQVAYTSARGCMDRECAGEQGVARAALRERMLIALRSVSPKNAFPLRCLDFTTSDLRSVISASWLSSS
mgnify:CR=1 FL=1